MPETPPDGSPGRDAEGAMGQAPAVEVADRERIRAGARAKLFGEPTPSPSAMEETEAGENGGRPEPLGDPERIGRFRILDRLGSGGMGVVYSAYDPELDRKVALKLLRPDLAEGGSGGTTGTSRLQREAQAMARLNHPNVVTVHEVGRHGEQVFVAMEFVEGTTLGAWANDDHDWRDIVRVYCDAAAGLAAAHEAGIVHRDFKPENVMLGDDGRVRVMDFGLSHAESSRHTLDDRADARTERPEALTQTGAIMGTPAYMAPEQHNASTISPASDQFAFCVSLWEALAGERPFAGQTYGELAGNVVVGRIRSPPATATAPRRVFDVLRTGLQVEPERRHPSMIALCEALQASPARTIKRIGVGVAIASAVGGIGYAALRPEPALAGACDDAGSPIYETWGPAERAAVRSALLETQAPYAGATWSTVERLLGEYANEWANAAENHCSARLVESAAATTLDRQEQCLSARRRALAEVVGVLSLREEGIAQQAVQAVATLTPIESCADPRRLEAFSTARAPEALEALAEARALLARARARGGMGHYDEALELAENVIETGRRFDDPSTEATGLLLRGRYLERKGDPGKAESSLRESIRLAEIAHDHTTRALGLIRLIYVVGRDSQRNDEARALGADAGAVLRMLGADPLLQAGLDVNLGGAARVARRFDEALVHYRAALDTYSELFGEAHPETGRVLTNLGSLYISREEPHKAIEVLLRAKASFEASLGAQHPFVPVVLSNLGSAYKHREDYDRSIATLREALRLRKATDGPNHPGIAKTLFNLGAAQFEARRYEDALASLDEGRRILRQSASVDPLRLGRYDLLIGAAQVNLGRFDDARETLTPLLEVFPLQRGGKGKYALRTRYLLSVATLPVDTRRASILAGSALDSAPEQNEEVVRNLKFLLWLYSTVEKGPTGL
ncbi:MAG: tetratricopeptide repeat protein [Nannocystaceae bacterium]|nr:serine/threonine-protein kinase [bacterium]